jgi:hypothetical protein
VGSLRGGRRSSGDGRERVGMEGAARDGGEGGVRLQNSDGWSAT